MKQYQREPGRRNRRLTTLSLLLATALGLMAARSPAAELVLLAGERDAFAAPTEPASPSTDLVDLIGVIFFQDFDQTAGINGGLSDREVAHTFTGLPEGIEGATLELRVRAGTNAGTTTDVIALLFAEPGSTSLIDALAWARTFGNYCCTTLTPDPDPGLITAGSWNMGSEALIMLDLAALPLAAGGTLDLIPQLSAGRFLDVLVDDETAVDFMELTLTFEPSIGSPAVPGLTIWGAATLTAILAALGSGWLRRRRLTTR